MNAAEIIKALQAPTPAGEIRWIPTVKKPKKWMWTAYVEGDYMRRKILEVSPVHDIKILSTWMDGTCKMVSVEVTLHGDDHDTVSAGISGAEPKQNVIPANRWKAAKTGAIKNALLELGFSLDIHGMSEWTKPDKEPNSTASRPSQQSQRPEQATSQLGSTHPEVIEERASMTPTEFWTAIRRMKIDQSLTREVLARQHQDFTAALSELATLAPQAA